MFYKHYTDLMFSARVVPRKVLIHGILFSKETNLIFASNGKKFPIDFERVFQFTDNCRGFMIQFMKYCNLQVEQFSF